MRPTYDKTFPGLNRTRCVTGKSSIYLLLDPRDNTVQYVGQTQNLEQRKRNHLGLTEHGLTGSIRLIRWKQELKELGLAPVLQPVDSSSPEKIDRLEIRWIAYYRQLGKILNVEAGGVPVPPKEQAKTKTKQKPGKGYVRRPLAPFQVPPGRAVSDDQFKGENRPMIVEVTRLRARA